MTNKSHRIVGYLLLVALIGVLTVGCAPKKNSRSKTGNMKPPKPPPAVPERQSVAIDPQLQAAAKQEIMTATLSNNPVIRAHAIEGIKDGLGVEGAAPVLNGLTDNAAVVRFAASLAAGELRLKQAHESLLVLSDDQDFSVRVGAKFALHRIGDTRQSRDLQVTARDPSPRVRGDTALVLGLLGEPSGVRVLLPMMFDANSAVRLQVAESLWRLKNEHGLEALVSASLSKFPDDRMIAILALAGPRDPRVLGHVMGALTSEYEEVCLVAARSAGMLGSDDGYGVALKGAKSTDPIRGPRQRLLAALAFGAIGRPDAQPVLAGLLRDPDQDVRIAAATAILQLKPQ